MVRTYSFSSGFQKYTPHNSVRLYRIIYLIRLVYAKERKEVGMWIENSNSKTWLKGKHWIDWAKIQWRYIQILNLMVYVPSKFQINLSFGFYEQHLGRFKNVDISLLLRIYPKTCFCSRVYTVLEFFFSSFVCFVLCVLCGFTCLLVRLLYEELWSVS